MPVKKVIILLIITLIWGVAPEVVASGERTVIDMEGRTVHLETNLERILVIGSALRLYTYIAGTEGLVGVERAQQNVNSGRPYIIAYPELANLPIVGEGHPHDPDPELIVQVNPQVIIAGDIMDRKSLELLENKTGIPVVMTRCGSSPVFDETTYTAIEVIGQVIGKEDRVEELIAYLDSCEAELWQLTKDIPPEEKPSVYMGGVSWKGTHGIESTQGLSALMQAINARNVADELGQGHLMIDKEKLVQWDPDIIIIDANGLPNVQDDYQRNPHFYQYLTAVQTNQVYSQLPYTSYYSNVETALADIYYIGKILYPHQFRNIDPVAKADEIYTFMLGQPLYGKMAKQFGGFRPIRLGE